ncbi:MAG: hypothetical protein OHK0017_00660 [Patescibacteria group bacterium]
MSNDDQYQQNQIRLMKAGLPYDPEAIPLDMLPDDALDAENFGTNTYNPNKSSGDKGKPSTYTNNRTEDGQ